MRPTGRWLHIQRTQALFSEFAQLSRTTILLDLDELAAPEIFAKVMRARDLPAWRDLDNSLYLLFAEIRKQSTMALSSEAADELFGGYWWFHNPEAIAADYFPGMVPVVHWRLRGTLLESGFIERVALPYISLRYHEALADVPRLPDETPADRRMREVCYLSLTRLVPALLDRKDRMSMANGLEVRVPFCDHRLVEYVFNTPWSFKTYDGRETSLLRGAMADLLPEPVAQRVKTPYPATQNRQYELAVRQRFADVMDDPQAPIRPFVDVSAAKEALTRPVGPVSMQLERLPMERLLTTNEWLSAYRPELA